MRESVVSSGNGSDFLKRGSHLTKKLALSAPMESI